MHFLKMFFFVFVALALMLGAEAKPGKFGAVKKGLGVIGAAGTAHDIWENIKNHHH